MAETNRVGHLFEMDSSKKCGTSSSHFDDDLFTILGSPKEAAEKIRQNLRITELESEVRHLKAMVYGITASRSIEVSEFDPQLESIISLTCEMFGEKPMVEVDMDPEEPEYRFVVFNVNWQGGSKDKVAKRIEWHKKVRSLSPGKSSIRLSFN